MQRSLGALAAAILFPLFLRAQSIGECARACDTFYVHGDYQKGLDAALACMKLATDSTGGNDSLHNTMLMRVGNFQYRLGQNEAAEATYRQLIAVREKVFGPASPEVATAMHSLGNALTQQGRLLESQRVLLAALAIRDAKGGKKNRPYAATVNSLGIVAVELGNLHEAEAYFTRATELYRGISGEQSKDYITSLGNLAQLNITLGNFERGAALLRQSLRVREVAFGKGHPMYASALSAMAELYQKLDRWPEAEPFTRRAIAIRREKLGEGHALTLRSWADLAKEMLETGRADSAEVVLRNLVRRSTASAPGDLADLLMDLGDVFLKKNRLDSAQAVFEKARFLQKPLLPDAQIGYLRSLQRSAQSAALLGQYGRADSLYREAQAIEMKQLSVLFPHFSDRERRLYFRPVAEEIERFATFTEQAEGRLPGLAARLLDLRLATRGILFSASQKMQEQFRRSGNAADFEAWRQARERLAQLYLMPPERPEALGYTAASLMEDIRSLEKRLVEKDPHFLENTGAEAVNWQQLRAALGPGEAAVEIVRFEKQAAAGPSGETRYAAIVVTEGTAERPFFVQFADGNELETVIYELYRAEAGQPANGPSRRPSPAFRNFWGPLEPLLSGKKRVFFALDGVFHKINLGALREADGLFLSEKFEFHYLTNLADLVRQRAAQPAVDGRAAAPFRPATALVMGDPAFDFFEKNRPVGEPGERPANPHFSDEMRGLDLLPLPGSGREAVEIGAFLKEKGCSAQVFTKKEATEGRVKSAGSPSVLHLATHGFFVEKKMAADTGFALRSPLLRSMLFFAGAENRLLDGGQNPADTAQDGILTAFEVQNLALDSTELVTLSACQTGLGEVVGGEGVFGLQRAFRVAGARALLMSLWDVDDEATRLLMTVFYEKWLDGLSKGEALREAERVVRAVHPQPEKWGGFVLIGE